MALYNGDNPNAFKACMAVSSQGETLSNNIRIFNMEQKIKKLKIEEEKQALFLKKFFKIFFTNLCLFQILMTIKIYSIQYNLCSHFSQKQSPIGSCLKSNNFHVNQQETFFLLYEYNLKKMTNVNGIYKWSSLSKILIELKPKLQNKHMVY